MTMWSLVPLGEVAQLRWRGESVHPEKSYPLIGVRLWGQGAYIRETIQGSDTKYSTLYRIESGDIIVNKIWARSGSVSVVNEATSGTFGSSEFPVYVPDTSRLLPEWFYWFSRSPTLWRQCEALSRGTSSQSRLKPERFLKVEIPLPSLRVQREIVARLSDVATRLSTRRRAALTVETDLQSTLRAVFGRIVVGAPRAKMNDVAPLVRRLVDIDPEQSYTEIGVKSFYRGVFHRRTLAGADFSWQKLYEVREGDVIFSNLMAWEQAIGLASDADEGCVGNHRMLMCEPDRSKMNPTFLWFYFTTPEGINQVLEASPGTIARNKTLSSVKLPEICVPLVDLAAQNRFHDLFTRVSSIREIQSEADAETEALIPSMLNQIFEQRNVRPTPMAPVSSVG